MCIGLVVWLDRQTLELHELGQWRRCVAVYLVTNLDFEQLHETVQVH